MHSDQLKAKDRGEPSTPFHAVVNLRGVWVRISAGTSGELSAALYTIREHVTPTAKCLESTPPEWRYFDAVVPWYDGAGVFFTKRVPAAAVWDICRRVWRLPWPDDVNVADGGCLVHPNSVASVMVDHPSEHAPPPSWRDKPSLL